MRSWALAALVASAVLQQVRGTALCNVMSFGAKGDGESNDTLAILKAASACPQGIYLPSSHVFLSWPLAWTGLAAGFQLQIDGELRAPLAPSAWPTPLPLSLIQVNNVSGFVLSGNGLINGSGWEWWAARTANPALAAPFLVVINACDNFRVTDVALANSPMYHLVVMSSANGIVDGISVNAPSNSPNTDGVDPNAGVTNMTIQNVVIANGDDGVAIKSGVSGVVVRDSQFINGHGVSIGSIGENNSSGIVTDVLVQNVSFTNSSTACRVKTWQGGSGLVANITYTDITMDNVDDPIQVTQFYCPNSQHSGPCPNSTINVNITGVTFANIRGTQYSGNSVSILCSDSMPCRDVVLANINLTNVKPGSKSAASCWQAFGTALPPLNPPSCLWGPGDE
jgi:polygalacturonase